MRRAMTVLFLAACGGDPKPSVDAPPPRPAQLQIDAPATLFDPTEVGMIETVNVTVANVGQSATGTIAIVATGDAAFTTQSGCTVLAAGATCAVAVSFSPAHTGQLTGQLAVTASPGGMGTVELTALALPANVLAIAPALLDFGGVAVGQTSAAPIVATVTNTGAVPTAALTVQSTGAVFVVHTDDCGGKIVAPGGTCTVSYDYAPTGTVVLGTDGDHGTVSVTGDPGGAIGANLHGNGFTLAIAPPPLNGGHLFPDTSVGATSAPATFTITNAYTQAIGPLATGFLVAQGPFALTADACAGKTLTPGQSCTFGVTFAPTATGFQSTFVQATAPMIGALRNDAGEGLFGTGI